MICSRNMVRKQLRSEVSCDEASNRWPIAFGTSKRVRTANRFVSSRAPSLWPLNMNSNTFRQPMTHSARCKLVPFRPSRKGRRYVCMFAQAAGSVPVPFLVILVFWLSAIFVSFTLFAQTNLIVMISLFVCALSFAGAIFLVLELDDPFTGLMGIFQHHTAGCTFTA
jgi:hypothetical protein